MLRVQTVFTGVTGSPYYNRVYFDGFTMGDAAACHARVAGFWDAIKGYIAGGVQIAIEGDVEVVDVSNGQVTAVHNVTPATYNSSASGQALPWATQGLLRLRTGSWVNGREVRGRIFIPSPAELHSDSNGPVAGYRNAVQSAVNSILQPGSNALIIWSPTHGLIRPVQSWQVWTEWAVLRSRRD